MGFFKTRGTDLSTDESARVPPGQYVTQRFPVLHAGAKMGLANWDFTVEGLVVEPGFWERHGCHMYGDPFHEQRYRGD
jgi:DMSO/TMAO reductase YedYZ molybdopterin-dependent catalytic subunit